MVPLMRSSGEILRKARLKRSLSQGQLAYLLGIARKDITRWERGHHSIGGDRLIKILSAMNFELVLQEAPNNASPVIASQNPGYEPLRSE
jgi:transcriptional regulator with XRE-family HTH domain